MKLPQGYERISLPRASAFAWSPVRDSVVRALQEHGTLQGWAASRPEANPLEGRGTVHAIDAPAQGPDGRSRWAVRHYLRGGAVAALLGDRYMRTVAPRTDLELRASCASRGRNVPTPAVVAGSVYPAGPLHYRADLITELVPSADDLAAVLFGPESGTRAQDPSRALHAAGVLLGRTAAAGIYHPDLNAKNIVLEARASSLTAHLIDLDRCRVRARPRTKDEQAMRARLHRSLHKHAARVGTTVPEDHLLRLEEGIVAGRHAPDGAGIDAREES